MDSGEESSKQSLTERPSAGASSSPAQQKQQRGTTQRQQQFSAKFKTDLNRSVQATQEALHIKKLIQDYTISFIKVGDKGKRGMQRFRPN
ncbi:uncharacterized protein LOC114076559 isoform X4 [Solanum pennellii]|uniref:Uncharacterized protein LOC114076559 isoform X4 n=1 Tax=Solanum pennellii TaxID=28526 RepID=A0ABM1V7G7_SOLPN|nr:uncharacterized protein LOC114076559 isoform X4 [Solanum pennellii]